MPTVRRYLLIVAALAALVAIKACEKDPLIQDPPGIDPTDSIPQTTPYDLQIPDHFPPMDIPADNPMTVEGVQLGRMLFYDPILSRDSTQSCGSCHNLEYGMTDNGLQFSVGITGAVGNRNSMALINLGWGDKMFWDGRSANLEEQALEPINNPIEMDFNWPDALVRLNNHPDYPELFWNAYGTRTIDSTHVAKAIAQFERTMISGDSKFDQWVAAGQDSNLLSLYFTQEELGGFLVFQTNDEGCAHCHGGVLTTDHDIRNNGLFEPPFADLGMGGVTNDPFDNGKFKVPTLRNIAATAPYMHDGSMATLEDVVVRYSDQMFEEANFDPVMLNHFEGAHGGLNMDPTEQAALVAFLHTFTDSTFLTNPDFKNPWLP